MRTGLLCPFVLLVACRLSAGPGDSAGGDDPDAAIGTPDASDVDAAVAQARSCSEVLAGDPAAISGTYEIDGPDGPVEVFCDMDLFGGGWTRVVDFDAAVDPCPGDWQPLDAPKVCHRNLGGAGVRLASFAPPIASYTEIAGYVGAYQKGSMDTFVGADVDGIYVDGVSITAAAFDTTIHVWTYSVSWSDDDNTENSLCPCLGGVGSPAFVDANFTCESGNTTGPPSSAIWYVDDPLWDGDGTGTDCDTSGNPSFFQRSFVDTLSSPLEVRLQADQSTENEDVGVYRMELYVR